MVRCKCGLEHADASTLAKGGWQAEAPGMAVLLVHCTCGHIVVAETRRDASICRGCRRLVTGADGDVKACAGEHGVLCVACHHRKFGLDAAIVELALAQLWAARA